MPAMPHMTEMSLPMSHCRVARAFGADFGMPEGIVSAVVLQ